MSTLAFDRIAMRCQPTEQGASRPALGGRPPRIDRRHRSSDSVPCIGDDRLAANRPQSSITEHRAPPVDDDHHTIVSPNRHCCNTSQVPSALPPVNQAQSGQASSELTTDAFPGAVIRQNAAPIGWRASKSPWSRTRTSQYAACKLCLATAGGAGLADRYPVTIRTR